MKLYDVKVGAVLVADGGFDCMNAGPKEVRSDNLGVYIECRDGRHYLDGQVSFTDLNELVGLGR